MCYKINSLLCLIILLPLLFAQNQNVIENTTPEYLENYLERGNVLVEYYFSLCENCNRTASLLDYLIEHHSTSLFAVVSIDCKKYSKHCYQHQIMKYPQIFGIRKNERPRLIQDSDSFNAFLNKQNPPERVDKRTESVEICEPGRVQKLEMHNFHSHLANGTHFVKFYSSGCVFCKVFSPIWRELAAELINEKNVCFAEFDCRSGMEICKDLSVTSVPSLIWYEDGRNITYKQGRNKMELRNFVTKSKKSEVSAAQGIFVNLSIFVLLLNIIGIYYLK